jgi:hypothetical protein
MAYDAARRRVVLFGGGVGVAQPGCCDTWEWDGTRWTQRHPPNPPAARRDHALTYDAARNRTVLFGGRDDNYVGFGDTWTWDGAGWIRRKPTSSPPARGGHAMVYDRVRKRVVLFGGAGASGVLSDTWEWDGTTWTRRIPRSIPPARIHHAMAYDVARRRVVLFGGWGASAILGDTWEWDGITWTRRTPRSSPPAQGHHAMAYDAARERVVLFGVRDGNALPVPSDTWEWDGTTWTRRKPVTDPPGRAGSALVYDSTRGVMVMFGGYATGFLSDRSQPNTWEFAPGDLAASTHTMSVATGGNVALSIDAGAAHAGKNHLVLGCLDGAGPRGLRAGGVTLLLGPDAYFWLTLSFPNTVIANSLGVLDPAGRATATVKVPPLPGALVGARFYHAYVVFTSRIDYASTPVPLTLVK